MTALVVAVLCNYRGRGDRSVGPAVAVKGIARLSVSNTGTLCAAIGGVDVVRAESLKAGDSCTLCGVLTSKADSGVGMRSRGKGGVRFFGDGVFPTGSGLVTFGFRASRNRCRCCVEGASKTMFRVPRSF